MLKRTLKVFRQLLQQALQVAFAILRINHLRLLHFFTAVLKFAQELTKSLIRLEFLLFHRHDIARQFLERFQMSQLLLLFLDEFIYFFIIFVHLGFSNLFQAVLDRDLHLVVLQDAAS